MFTPHDDKPHQTLVHWILFGIIAAALLLIGGNADAQTEKAYTAEAVQVQGQTLNPQARLPYMLPHEEEDDIAWQSMNQLYPNGDVDIKLLGHLDATPIQLVCVTKKSDGSTEAIILDARDGTAIKLDTPCGKNFYLRKNIIKGS